MMRPKKCLQFFSAIAISLASAHCQAQQAESPGAATAPAIQFAADQSTANWNDLLQASISIDQPSGSVGQFIETIRQNSPKLNIVVTESAGAHRLPEIMLESVPIFGALSLLPKLTHDEIQVNFESQEEGSAANIVLISGEDGQNLENVLTVRVLNIKRLLQEANHSRPLAQHLDNDRPSTNGADAVTDSTPTYAAIKVTDLSDDELRLLLAATQAQWFVAEIDGKPTAFPLEPKPRKKM